MLLSALDHANAAAIAANLLSLTKTPVVAAVHAPRRNAEQYGNGIPGRLRRFAVNGMYRRAHTVICVSKGVAAEIIGSIGVPRERVRVIYNPVVHQRIYEMAQLHSNTTGLCRALANLCWLSGPARAAKEPAYAASRPLRTVREGDNVRLTILGEGGERGRWRSW